MSDPNPYESPRSEQPLKPAQIARRGIGGGVILLLAFPVTLVTFFVTCSTSVVLDLQGPVLPFSWGAILLLGPPALVFVCILVWAILVRRRKLLQESRTASRLSQL